MYRFLRRRPHSHPHSVGGNGTICVQLFWKRPYSVPAMFTGYCSLQKHSLFQDQWVVPELAANASYPSSVTYLLAPGGHVAIKATFDEVRDRSWSPNLYRGVQSSRAKCEVANREEYITARRDCRWDMCLCQGSSSS